MVLMDNKTKDHPLFVFNKPVSAEALYRYNIVLYPPNKDRSFGANNVSWEAPAV